MPTTLDIPDEGQSRMTNAQVRHIIVAVLCLVCAANLLLVALIGWYRAHASMEHSVVAQKWQQVAQASPPYDILLVGDSSGLYGVDPEVIARRSGLRCYNACAFGQLLLANEAWLLQHLEALGRVPPIVVSIHVHDIWNRDADLLRRRLGDFPADIRPWERYEPRIQPAARSSRERSPDWLPLVKAPKESQMALSALWSSLLHNRLNTLGLCRLPTPDPSGALRDARRHLELLGTRRPDSPALSPINQQAFENMVALLARHGSSLLMVEAPTVEQLAADQLYLADLERNSAALSAVAAGRADFAVARTGRPGFAPELMQNADHIADETTRRHFSEWVADHVVEVIARRRSATTPTTSVQHDR